MKTFADAKASRIPIALNISSTDSRFADVINEAQERLLHMGKWHGTVGRYRISITSQLLTLPAEIATIEQIAVSECPLPVRGQWFELMPSGWGERDETETNGSGIAECLFLDYFPTIADIATAGIITLKCDVALDVDKEVLVLGLDENGNTIRTLDAGVWSDGESIPLKQGAGQASTHQFSKITGIQAPSDLDGKWYAYSGTVAAGTLIGTYEYWETNPKYRRYMVPFINTDVSTVLVKGKKAFRKVVNDTDELIIGNLAALKLGAMAVLAEEEHNWAEAQILWYGGVDQNGIRRIGAVQLLNAELQHHTGDGETQSLSISGGEDFVDTESMV